MASDYQQELGERLRAIRKMQRMTLQDVEERSDGQWKAVVIGSYERGDRAISVAKLARLARFYGVPVSELLPRASTTDDAVDEVDGELVIDLRGLDGEAPGALGALSRYAHRVQLQRGDYNGHVLSLRTADVEAIAAACGVPPQDLVDELEERRVLRR